LREGPSQLRFGIAANSRLPRSSHANQQASLRGATIRCDGSLVLQGSRSCYKSSFKDSDAGGATPARALFHLCLRRMSAASLDVSSKPFGPTLCPDVLCPTGSPVFGPPEVPPTFRSAAFLLVRLQTPLSWVWPLRDGHDFSLPLRFLDHFSSCEEGGPYTLDVPRLFYGVAGLVFLLSKRDVRFEACISPVRLLPQLADPTGVEARCTSLLPLSVFKDCSSDSQRPPAGVPTDI